MSERDVELTRRFTAAWNSRDVQAIIAYCDPGIELHSTFAAIGGAVYHGHDAIRRQFRDFDEAWGNEIRVEPEAYFDFGERTLVFHVVRGRGRHSGAEVAMPIAVVCRWRDGLVVYLKGYTPEKTHSETSASPRTSWSRSSRECEPRPRALDL